MNSLDLDRFRRTCGRLRGLAAAVAITMGGAVAFTWIGQPLWRLLVEGRPVDAEAWRALIGVTPLFFYLFAVWMISAAMGNLAKGRLIQPTVATALRHVGLALGIGALISVFVVGNVTRALGYSDGGFVRFDVAAMTLGVVGGALFVLGRVIEHAGFLQAELEEMI